METVSRNKPHDTISPEMALYQWERIEEEQLNPLVSRKVIHTDRMTIARLKLKKGAVVPRHSHENEQVTNLETGVLRFLFDDGEQLLRAGESLTIPSYAPHSVEALEDSLAVDLFAPVREDWRSGDDAYLRQSVTTSQSPT
jgi:quercetin dioxygenase-like cupin family protein